MGALVAAVTAAASLYVSLPERLPVHFTRTGVPDQILGKGQLIAAVIIPLLVLYVVLEGLIWIFPQRRSPQLRPVYSRFAALGIVAVAAGAITVLWLLPANRGGIDGILTLVVGLITMALGNYMPKTTPNLLVGIRTPWTLADDDVWFRTHRMAAPLFMTGGALLVGAGIAGWAPATALIVLPPVAVIATLYSYVTYRRVHKIEPDPHGSH